MNNVEVSINPYNDPSSLSRAPSAYVPTVTQFASTTRLQGILWADRSVLTRRTTRSFSVNDAVGQGTFFISINYENNKHYPVPVDEIIVKHSSDLYKLTYDNQFECIVDGSALLVNEAWSPIRVKALAKKPAACLRYDLGINYSLTAKPTSTFVRVTATKVDTMPAAHLKLWDAYGKLSRINSGLIDGGGLFIL